MTRARIALRLLAAFALALLAAAAIGCRTITPAELDEFGTHTYPGKTKAQVMTAVVTALKGEGYEIVVNDATQGRVKTGPKIVMVHATGNQYSAQAAASEMAWTIDVGARDSNTMVRAMPRGYQAGQAIEATKFSYAYAMSAFKTLFDEIDDNLGGGDKGADKAGADGSGGALAGGSVAAGAAAHVDAGASAAADAGKAKAKK